MHYTQTKRPEKKQFLEVNSGEILVEVGAYVPAKTRIENLMNAGRRLNESRIEQYDYPDGIVDEKKVLDPTRQPNYDMSDAFQDSEVVMDRIENQIQATKKAASESKGNLDDETKDEPKELPEDLQK